MSAVCLSSTVPKARFCIFDWDEARVSTPDKEVVIRPITETATIILPCRFTFDSRMYFAFRKINLTGKAGFRAAFFRSRSIAAMISQCKRLHFGPSFLRATSIPAMRLLLHREIGNANFDHRALPSALGAGRILRRLNLVRWLFRPHSENASTKCSDPGVITKEDASGLERIIGPSIVRKIPAAIRRTRQYHDLLAILR